MINLAKANHGTRAGMTIEEPRFEVRQSLGGYVVCVIWPDGRTETASGVHETPAAAAEWVRHRAKRWLKQRATSPVAVAETPQLWPRRGT
jgi:hypothetical protein